MLDLHRNFNTAHPGWSFPAKVYSDAFPLDAEPNLVALHAAARGYTEACPPVEPGQFCKKDGAVIPRGGVFPEGEQPPGTEGWTRPLALEPIQLGVLLGPDAEVRWHLPLSEAPDSLIAAIIAAEDEEFREHPGVDFVGLARAVWINSQGGTYSQGASTLTMQVVRNLNQQKEKTIERKIREIGAALATDAHLGKDGVLQMYLDAPYLGQAGSLSICGFRAAALYYWGKDIGELTLAQHATLAAILPAPGRYAPDRNPEEARSRRDMVLRRMASAGWDVTEALAEPVAAEPHEPLPVPLHPAYLQAARVAAEEALPASVLYGAGLSIFTALDLVAQDTTESLLVDKVSYLTRIIGKREDPLEVAGVLIRPQTGNLLAVYGGTQLTATDFSRATQARRQPGSSFKPLVYALAFSQLGEDGLPTWRAQSTVKNNRRVFENTDGWTPRNISGDYSATTTLAQGLTWSQNVAAASLLEDLGGPRKLIEFAGKIGYETGKLPEEMGIALGQGEVTPLEQARFVAMVINGGYRVSGSPLVLVKDVAGKIRWSEPGIQERVLTAESAALTLGLMRLVIISGTGGASRGGGGFAGYQGPAIGKTGTTDMEKDLWFIGGSPLFASAMWLGYDQPHRIGGSASDLASPLWGWWMKALHDPLKVPEDFDMEVELTGRGVCTMTGRYSNGTCRTIGAPFLPGDKPEGVCGIVHPPPDPEHQKYEGLWKRRQREQEEREAARLAEEQGEGAGVPPEAAVPEPEEGGE
jgi:membrane peptidoglycan carboxypeptidase